MGRLRLVLPISRGQLFLILLSFLILSFVGCSRGFYRKQADHQVSRLLRETSHDPDGELNRHDIRVKRISRMYDPFSPDDPPLPPDDPAAHRLMHCVDCKRGYPCWHASGDTPYVASPLWMEFLPLDEDGILYLDAALAVRLALVNAPAYQSEFETLFLSALDVTAERFAFDKQVFAGTNARYTSNGQRRTGRGVVSSELALPASGLRVEKMFTTGAEMVVGLANSIVWEFSGPDTNATSTLLDFTLVQPLLRRAGRDRIMETLTLSERTLLYNVRQIERFRRGFYLEIVTGRQAERGPTRRGGFFGTSGLTGFTGVGAGGFGGVGGAGGFGFGGGGAGAAQAGGFMGLLQSQQDIRNQESNIAGLRSSLLQLEESLRESLRKISDRPDDILRQRLQIAQARQALVNAQSRLLNSQNQYQGELDQFKLDLGLPPTICLVIDDPLLHQIVREADVVSPWTVGRYRTLDGVSRHATNVWRHDQAWCRREKLDFLPVVFPGFSWHNLKRGKLDQIPRLKGEFLWSQVTAAKRVGCDRIYVAMFDEIDEGTAIFKCTNDPPKGGGVRFLTYEGLPSDHYLALTGKAGRLLRNHEVPEATSR